MHNPFVPETLEGWSALHLMFRIDWDRLRARTEGERVLLSGAFLEATIPPDLGDSAGSTAFVQLLGHKADLMLILFRRTFEELGRVELMLRQTELHGYLIPTTSYVSIVELGMYDMTAKVHRQLRDGGLEPGSDAHAAAFDAEMERQRQRVIGRLFTAMPPARHVCFYPMNKRRGEVVNWYVEPFERRAEMMLEHGKVGREYAGKVTQIISGSIGFDDWEWGVDLFADDPMTFKKLIYEMRFDEASAKFAEFGPFYVGLQFASTELPTFLAGRLPNL